MLIGEGLCKAYGQGSARAVILDGVDVRVRRGEFVVVTGPSGSGKTTLLHCLSGLATPDAGRVLLDGVDLASLSDDARTDVRAQRMGFVFQTLNLLPALNARENVELPLILAGLRTADVRARAGAALESVGLGDRGPALPAQLSAGEQQRVAVARAVVTDPDVLWADEPTGALDTVSATQVLELLRGQAGKRTVVVVSHDPTVAALADSVITVSDGRVV